MIQVHELTKRFGTFVALDKVNMTVSKGAVYGLVGPNGAGKTTLLRHLTGVLRQDEGHATIENQPIFENPIIKARIASIPDDLYVFGSASIMEMKQFYTSMYESFDNARFEKLKEAFALNVNAPIRRFSKGQTKQAFFWLSVCLCPDVVLLDEPVDGLDPVMRRQVWNLLLADVAERGSTVLVSSHNLRELEDVCDHVGIMHKGKMLLEGSLEALQGNAVKVQVVFEGGFPELPPSLQVLHTSQIGRVHTIIARGTKEAVEIQLKTLNPIFVETVPLTLEEVFLYELGGEQYAIRDILL